MDTITAPLLNLNNNVSKGGIHFEYPSFEILSEPTEENIKQFEVAARTCYRSEHKITEDLSSGKDLLNKVINKKHLAMIEFFPDLVVKIRTNRGVTHELVRMRLCSFAQESTRYVRYGEVPYILPYWSSAYDLYTNPEELKNKLFLASCLTSADIYGQRLQAGCSPQEARGSLNNDVASFINVKANMREWLHIFGLRTDNAAHPDMRVLMCGLAGDLFHSNSLMAHIFSYYDDIMKNIEWFYKSYVTEKMGHTHHIIPDNDFFFDGPGEKL